MDPKYRIALMVLVFGGIDLGLIGLVQNDIISMIFGQLSALSRILYILIGVCAGYIGATTFIFKKD